MFNTGSTVRLGTVHLCGQYACILYDEYEIMCNTHSHPQLGSDLTPWNVVLVTSSIDRLPFFSRVLPTDCVAERRESGL